MVEAQERGVTSETGLVPGTGMSRASVAVLVPCYNASRTAFEVLHALDAYAGTALAVNDGSTDDTTHWLKISPVETIGWDKNRGKGYALVEGIRTLWAHPGWEVLVTVDSDGQHDPADIPALIETYERSGADIVVGVRDLRTKEAPAIRRIANRFSTWAINRAAGTSFSDVQSGFRLFSRGAVQRLLPQLRGGTFEVETDMLLLADHLGLQVGETPVRTTYTEEAIRRSSWRRWKHSRLIFEVCLRHVLVRKRSGR